MSSFKKRSTWYGMLESRKGDAVLVWDPIFPKSDKGKVFLYNTRKDKLTEYVEEILTPKLRELTSKELSAAKKEYGKSIEQTRSQFAKKAEVSKQSRSEKPADTEIKSVISEITEDDVVIDDEFEDL